jgi:hypothetical protein
VPRRWRCSTKIVRRSDLLQKVVVDEVREGEVGCLFDEIQKSRRTDRTPDYGWSGRAAAKAWMVMASRLESPSGPPSSSEGRNPERCGIHGGEAVVREARGLPLEIGNRLALRGAGYYCIPLCTTYQHSIAADIAVLHEPDIMRRGL